LVTDADNREALEYDSAAGAIQRRYRMSGRKSYSDPVYWEGHDQTYHRQWIWHDVLYEYTLQ